MLFNSLEFLIFFPIVVALYFALPNRFRWVLLLIASYYFYMVWNYKFVFLIFITTFINYLSGIGIVKAKSKALRIFYLSFGLIVSFGILFYYKYFNFFGDSFNSLFEQFNIACKIPAYNLLLPVGISFFTFQTLSYTIDVYNGRQPVEYHFGKFALFVSFFPQLVAGPIERSTNLLPQFYKQTHLSYENFRNGVVLALWGFFKKVVIADRLSEYVNLVYNNPADYQGMHFLVATLFFTVQIYCDFSGYSDIARGTAKIMGYDLMINFRMPYLSKSIREFWQRWHISLSTWFRDYFYISLGGNRVAKWRHHLNIFLTFLISGLWHGANWTFVIWGALHGFYQIFGIWTKPLRSRFNAFIGLSKITWLDNFLQTIITCALAVFAWIFFRAANFNEALYIIKGIWHIQSVEKLNLFTFQADMYLSIVLIAVLFIVDLLEEKRRFSERLKLSPVYMKWIMLAGIVFSILVLGKWDQVDFLYFQF